MGARVYGYDVRPVAKEQVESMGGTFLTVSLQEDGSGSGGYAKEMSEAYKAAEREMLSEEVSKADIIITTALIPGRKAPLLVPGDMVARMRRGSVIVDMASVNGGNVAMTADGEVVTTPNGVKILGYSDLPSRLPTAASELYGSNAAKFLLSVGPMTGAPTGVFYIDHADPAVRGMLVVENGHARWPSPPYEPPKPPPVAAKAEIVVQSAQERATEKVRSDVGLATVIVLATLGIALGAGDSPEAAALFAVFALSSFAGQRGRPASGL